MKAFSYEYRKAKTKDHLQRTFFFFFLLIAIISVSEFFSLSTLSFKTATGGDYNPEMLVGRVSVSIPEKKKFLSQVKW